MRPTESGDGALDDGSAVHHFAYVHECGAIGEHGRIAAKQVQERLSHHHLQPLNLTKAGGNRTLCLSGKVTGLNAAISNVSRDREKSHI